ncbi:MAG: glutaredoxin family protein [Pseudomonadota bacterium]
MKIKLLCLLTLCSLVGAINAQAEMYKWVGPDGKITYGDTPPPDAAKQVEKKTVYSGGSNDSNLPFELAEAVKNHPVTLYTTPKCVPCDNGRALLSKRGIPFSEKTVVSNEDFIKLQQLSADGQLPALLVGRDKQSGFEAGAWGAALSAAGYPETNRLPKSYKNQAAEPAAPKLAVDKEKPAVADTPAARRKEAAAAPEVNTKPGFQF